MRCAKCSIENREGRKFCAECGAALNVRCRSCGAENEPAEKFCGKCGAALDAPVSTPVSATPPIQSPEMAGERRHLTVLFCDLVGSTGIAARLDPEQWRETLAGFHGAAAEAITRFDGHVAKYLGDGVMAYFGWPAAHDNDAERAARAGLAILDAIAKLNEQPGHAKLSARVGIDSGTVVIGQRRGQRGGGLRRRTEHRGASGGGGCTRHGANHARRRIGWSRACSSSRIAARMNSRASNGRFSSIA